MYIRADVVSEWKNVLARHIANLPGWVSENLRLPEKYHIQRDSTSLGVFIGFESERAPELFAWLEKSILRGFQANPYPAEGNISWAWFGYSPPIWMRNYWCVERRDNGQTIPLAPYYSDNYYRLANSFKVTYDCGGEEIYTYADLRRCDLSVVPNLIPNLRFAETIIPRN